MNVCNTFINRPINSYRPLACKPIVVQTRELRGTGQANKNDLFFLTKPNTIREHATIDLLFTHPNWLREAVQETTLVRVTANGFTRVTDLGLVRILP